MEAPSSAGGPPRSWARVRTLSAAGQEAAVAKEGPNPLVKSKGRGSRTAGQISAWEGPKSWNCKNEEYGKSGMREVNGVLTGEQALALCQGFKNK